MGAALRAWGSVCMLESEAVGAGDRPNRPVFLVGCHRSGTTLARRLLDAHPAIACPPESKFIAGLRAFFVYPQAVTGLLSLGVPVERMLGEARRLTEQVFSDYARACGKRRWIDKTPNYFRILPFIDRMFGQDAMFLFMVRHPLDTVASLLEGRRFLASDPDVAAALSGQDDPAAGLARYWCTVNRALKDFASRHPDRVWWFRYEDLVSDPNAVLAQVLRFIGEEPGPDLTAIAFLDRPWAAGYQDWKILSTTAVRTDRVDVWRETLGDGAAIWDLVAPLAASWGYSYAPDAAPVSSPRLADSLEA